MAGVMACGGRAFEVRWRPRYMTQLPLCCDVGRGDVGCVDWE